ncbi:complement C1q-like protein 2 isoform X1 [Engraulis encrasicolus]|uniref:complement C1q-like protein 2 isoform X1 n=1 Tax=Engraulis encrasicolus TaxID=184585 RepID=UPI002FD75791
MKMTTMMMKSFVLLLLAVGCCVCQGQSTCSMIRCIESKVNDLQTRLEQSEKEVEDLRTLVQGRPQVAFSASLGHVGVFGPVSEATTLQYTIVFSNTGNGYNSTTGVFTAPVKGMYFFRYSAFSNYLVPGISVVSLWKNNEVLVSTWDDKGQDPHDMGGNAVVIAMETGDTAYAQLSANAAVFNDAGRYNTFSGFLLFTT